MEEAIINEIIRAAVARANGYNGPMRGMPRMLDRLRQIFVIWRAVLDN